MLTCFICCYIYCYRCLLVLHLLYPVYCFQKYMTAERNDQTKKVNNRFRPPETNISFRQGRLGATKKRILAKTRLPTNDCSIWPIEHVQGGMPDTIRGPTWANTAVVTPICFILGCFPPSYIYIYVHIATPCGTGYWEAGWIGWMGRHGKPRKTCVPALGPMPEREVFQHWAHNARTHGVLQETKENRRSSIRPHAGTHGCLRATKENQLSSIRPNGGTHGYILET